MQIASHQIRHTTTANIVRGLCALLEQEPGYNQRLRCDKSTKSLCVMPLYAIFLAAGIDTDAFAKHTHMVFTAGPHQGMWFHRPLLVSEIAAYIDDFLDKAA